MTELITEPAAEPVTEPVTEAVYFGTDGSMKDGWQSTMPEGYRDEKSLAGVTNAQQVAKMFVDTKRMVGKDVIAIPTDASTEGEWEQFYQAGGRPDTAADYNLAIPDDYPEDLSGLVFPEGRLALWQDRLYKAGINKKTAHTLISAFAQDQLENYQKVQLDAENTETELINGLTRDWGAAYDQNIHLGNMAVEEGTNGDAEFKARVVAKIQKDPDLTRFASNLGNKFAEGRPPNYAAIPTPGDLQDKIDTLMADPLYTNGTQKQRMAIANKIMNIREQMKPADG